MKQKSWSEWSIGTVANRVGWEDEKIPKGKGVCLCVSGQFVPGIETFGGRGLHRRPQERGLGLSGDESEEMEGK